MRRRVGRLSAEHLELALLRTSSRDSKGATTGLTGLINLTQTAIYTVKGGSAACQTFGLRCLS